MTAIGVAGPALTAVDFGDDLTREQLLARTLSGLTLDGRKADAMIGHVLRDVRVEPTLEGASVCTIDLIDEGGALLDSGLFSARVRLELADRYPDDPEAFELVQIRAGDNGLSLTFEDEAVAKLRRRDKPRKANRDQVTRAGFGRMLVREVPGVGYWSPELRKRQPIGKRRELPSRRKRDEDREHGFAAGARVTVKGVRADRSQLRVIDTVLEVGESIGATKRELVGAVMCVNTESEARNLVGGDADSRGAFQQQKYIAGKRTGWPASRDVAKDARGFFKPFMVNVRRYAGTGKSLGWLVDQTQRSYTFGTSRQGSNYMKWFEEATIAVNEWIGDGSYTPERATTTYDKRYWFRRGEPGGEREDTWAALERLFVQEVKWFRWCERGTVRVASPEHLLASRPRLIVDRRSLPAGIDSVRIADFDAGKDVAEAELRYFADLWRPPIGSTIRLDHYGPGSGKYLLASYSESRLSPVGTAKLLLPAPSLPEPAPETVTRTGGGSAAPSAEVRNRAAIKLDRRWGGSLAIFEQFVTPFMARRGLSPGSQKRSTQTTASGGTSDHWTGSTGAYAIDYPTMSGERAARALAQAMGYGAWRPNSYASFIVRVDGQRFRVQILWGGGIDHGDHVHVGIRRV